MTQGHSSIRLGAGVYSAQLAARLARVSTRRLRYWVDEGLITPSAFAAPARGHALFTYTDLVKVRVIGRLRLQRASLQKIRRAIDWLTTQLQDDAWHEKTMWTDGRDVYWIDGPDAYSLSQRPGQGVIKSFVVDMREAERDIREVGQDLGLGDRISVDAAVQGGAPVIRDTRLTTRWIAGLLADGMSPTEVAERYPELAVDDVEAARSFEERLKQAS